MTFKVLTLSFTYERPPKIGAKIEKGDISKWFVDGSSDAIVNPTNMWMIPEGGTDLGWELHRACLKFPEVLPGVRCPIGEARITPGFKLPASHVIHTAGPMYFFDPNPEASLKSAYKSCLSLAKANKIQYIAFPAISCGLLCYPHEEAATIAISTVKEFVNDFKEVHFILFTDAIYDVWLRKAKELLELEA